MLLVFWFFVSAESNSQIHRARLAVKLICITRNLRRCWLCRQHFFEDSTENHSLFETFFDVRDPAQVLCYVYSQIFDGCCLFYCGSLVPLSTRLIETLDCDQNLIYAHFLSLISYCFI